MPEEKTTQLPWSRSIAFPSKNARVSNSGKRFLPDLGHVVEPAGRRDEVELDAWRRLRCLDNRQNRREAFGLNAPPDVGFGRPLLLVTNRRIGVSPDRASQT